MANPENIPFGLGCLLYQGTNSFVYQAVREDLPDTHPEASIVAKFIILPGTPDVREHEIQLLDAQLAVILTLKHHDNLVRHLQYQLRPVRVSDCDVECYCILMEYCAGGNLHNAVKIATNRQYVPKWTRQICEGLSHLHGSRIVHRDIKGANILLTSTDYPSTILKIADLGDYKQIKSVATKRNEVSHSKGTVGYMSPEMMLGEEDSKDFNIGRKTDIWNLGCVLIQMYTGINPRFVKHMPEADVLLEGDMAIIHFVGSGGHPDVPSDIPPEAGDFIRQCLQRQPSDRPTVAELLKHSFLAQ